MLRPRREPLIHEPQGVVDARDRHDREDGAEHLLPHHRRIEGGLDYRGRYESPPDVVVPSAVNHPARGIDEADDALGVPDRYHPTDVPASTSTSDPAASDRAVVGVAGNRVILVHGLAQLVDEFLPHDLLHEYLIIRGEHDERVVALVGRCRENGGREEKGMKRQHLRRAHTRNARSPGKCTSVPRFP